MIDLHCHSICSDGSLSPAELLREAERIGLTYFSISDHNSVSAYEAAGTPTVRSLFASEPNRYEPLSDPAVRALFSGKLIRGVELTTYLNGEMVEVLGYGIEPSKMLPIIQEIRTRGTSQRMLELLYEEYTARGVQLPFPMEEYDAKVYLNPRRYVFKQLVDIPENHRFFLDFEAHTDHPLTYYRQELYNPQSPLYIDCAPLYAPIADVIDAIHQAGGLAFLAHSYCYTENIYDQLDAITDQLPLDGLECYYSTFTPEQIAEITALCKRKGLFMSGGCDFHGKLRPGISIGTGKGDLSIPDSVVADWIEPYTF